MPELPEGFVFKQRAGDKKHKLPNGFSYKSRRAAPIDLAAQGNQAQRDVAAALPGADARLIAMGSAVNDVGRNLGEIPQATGFNDFLGDIGIIDPEREEARRQQVNARSIAREAGPRAALEAEQPINNAIGRGIGEAGMFAATGGATSIPAALIAGGSTAALASTPDQDPWVNFGVGASLGALVPVAAKSIASFVSRLSSKPLQALDDAGRLTPEAKEVLIKADVAPEELGEDLVTQIRRSGVGEKEVDRIQLFEDLGIQPTTANVTQAPGDFVFQNQSVKTGGAVADLVAEQDKAISAHFDNMLESTGAEGVDLISSGQRALDVAFDRVNAVDEAVNQAYTAARAAAPQEKIVNVGRLASKMRQFRSQNPDFIRSVKSDLEQRGLIDGLSAKGRRASVESVEEARQAIRQIINDDPAKRSRIGKQLIDALDDDVSAVAGTDVFKDARAVKSRFERSVERARTTRRDAGKATLLENVIENRVDAKDVINKVRTARVEDIKQLKEFYLSGSQAEIEAGHRAWNEVRAGVLRDLYEKASPLSGKIDDQVLGFSGPKFTKALNAIQNDRLNVLFSPEEMTMLGRLSRLGELRTPTVGTATGTGPSGVAVELMGAGRDAATLATNLDPSTALLSRITFGLFSKIRQARAERRFVQPVQEIAKSLPKRITQGATIQSRP